MSTTGRSHFESHRHPRPIRNGLVGALLSLDALAAMAETPLVIDRFDTDATGWSARDVPGGELCNAPGEGVLMASEYLPTGGNPGGYVRLTEPGNTGIDPLFRSGYSFRGDFSAGYGGFIRYDRRMNLSGGPGDVADVYLQGLVGGLPVTLVADTPGFPVQTWKASRIPLLSGVWRVGGCTGPIATEQEIGDVLSSVTTLLLRAEYRSGVETQDIDNVMLVAPGAAPQSTFEADIDGWAVQGDATVAWDDVPWAHPQCLLGVDMARGIGYDFVAPVKFLGDQALANGLTLELDLWASPSASQTQAEGGAPGFVRIGNADMTLRYNRYIGAQGEQPITGSRWRHHAVPLRPSPAWTRSTDGAIAIQADFDAVLASVTSLVIRGEYRTGGESERLDNVVLGSCAPSVVVTAGDTFETTVSTCPYESVLFPAVAAGVAPFAYQWQIESPPNSFDYVDLVDDAPFVEAATGLIVELTGTGTDALAVTNTSLGSHPGMLRFRVIVSNECGTYTSASAGLTVVRTPGDTNGDGDVDFSDVLVVLAEWGPCDGCPADLDDNGTVDFGDVLILLSAWGPCMD